LLVTVGTFLTDVRGEATTTLFAVPAGPALVGSQFACQAMTLPVVSGTLGAFSNGVVVTVGG
jgi:hypothetical protein